MTDEQLQLAQMQINALNQNDKKCLKEIYGDIWGQINNPTEFGKKFKNAVQNKLLSNIKHLGIRKTGRCDEYEKI